MMRLINSVIALCFVIVGVVFGAMNREIVHVDLWFRSVDARLGLILLTVLLLGALIGGLVVTAGVVWPLRRRMHPAGPNASGPGPEELSSDRAESP